jgi:2-polyprenyl-3-methyl-5-hydroxy-6-metoxy-1,4-benzoquinol methylase
MPDDAKTDITDDGARYMDDPRAEVAQLVPAGVRILDVGCSRGAFGAELKRLQPARAVYGIEPTAAAAYAEARLDHVVQGFFPGDLPEDWRDFDVVCFNDVLEHMVDPWSVLAATVAFLAPDGRVVASIPNVRYVNVIIDLVLRGQWHYESTGVLDRTHLRFFTRSSIVELFEASGFSIDRLVATHQSESNRLSARILRGAGLTHRFSDLLAQRYVAIAQVTNNRPSGPMVPPK